MSLTICSKCGFEREYRQDSSCTCYPKPETVQTEEILEELANLKEQLRWRKWPDEKPEQNGLYQISEGCLFTHMIYSEKAGGWEEGWNKRIFLYRGAKGEER